MQLPLSDAEIALVASELAPRLLGEVAGRVWQPDAHTLILELGRERLLLSTHPKLSRLHLAARAPSTEHPPAFAMLLRKHLGGRRLQGFRVTPGDRVVELDFGELRVVAELTPPHADVVLVSEGNVLATLHHRPPGTPYTAPPPPPEKARWRGRLSIQHADEVAAAADTLVLALREQTLRDALGTKLRRELERAVRRTAAIERDLARLADAEGDRKLADLLLAHAHSLPTRGATSVTVPDDFTDGSPLVIEIDPALDVRQNAAKLYARHKRLAHGRVQSETRLLAAMEEVESLTERLHRLPHVTLDELERLAPPPPAPRRRKEVVERLPFHVFTSQSGDEIWVGRTAKDNDALTFRHARGNDVWLHIRDSAGSHVVIPQRGKQATGEATFVDAATLAVRYSKLREELQADVTYTHVKHLRKAKGMAAGKVFVAESKTFRVRVEPGRLERLLASRTEPGD
jgi:predicted ribosome quality control (RQC) complex YloA/Tae2 family protein